MQQSNAIVTGSLSDVAKREDVSLAESFLSCDAIILCDVSGSMGAYDSRGGKTRYEVALEELAALQAHMPGKLAIIAFSDNTLFVPGGAPPLLGMGTNLTGALRFAKVADVPGMRFVVISDGQPDDPGAALAVAATYKAKISTIFCGRENDTEGGRAFLLKLATASGGQAVTADRAKELASKTAALLLRA